MIYCYYSLLFVVLCQQEEEMEKNARQRAVEYFLDKENKVEVKVRYDRLRRAFYEPPSVDNRDREKIIASVKNIVFLFLEAKMIENKLKLADVIPKFDLDGKGDVLSTDDWYRNWKNPILMFIEIISLIHLANHYDVVIVAAGALQAICLTMSSEM